jgi:hypothetical protein
MPQLGYWVANWDLSEAEAAVQLGGDVDYMVDTIGTDAKTDLSFLVRSNIRKLGVYVTGSVGVVWTPGEIAAYRLAGFVVVTIDQHDGGPILVNVADVESGAKTPAQAIIEAEDALGRGMDFAIYVDQSRLPALEAAWAQTGREPGRKVAIQWASPTSNPDTVVADGVTIRQANVDLSVTVRDWHPLPAVKPPAPASTPIRRAVVTYDKASDGWSVIPGVSSVPRPGDHATVTWDESKGPGWSIKPGVG